MGGLSYLYLLNVTVHVTAAVAWLGGMFFLALVGAPVLRKLEPPALRASVFAELGRQFRSLGWIALALLLVTGTLNLYFRGVLSAVSIGSAHFWRTPFGGTLALKLTFVLLMLVVQALHDFRWGPAASRALAGSPAATALRRRAALAARVNAVLGLLILIAAVRLARGG